MNLEIDLIRSGSDQTKIQFQYMNPKWLTHENQFYFSDYLTFDREDQQENALEFIDLQRGGWHGKVKEKGDEEKALGFLHSVYISW